MEFNCVWFINQLWKEKTLFSARVPLVDTLLFDSQSPTNCKWLFTDRKGFIKKKHTENTKVDKIILSFLNHSPNPLDYDNEVSNPEDPGVVFIRDNIFKLINRKASLSKLFSLNILKNEAIQAFPAGVEHKNSRYIVTAKKKDGKYMYTCNKECLKNETLEVTKVFAQNYTDKLVEIAENAIKVVERNSRRCIEELHLVFFEGNNDSLWLMGSRFCKAANLLVTRSSSSLKRTQSQGRFQENSISKASFMMTTKSWTKRINSASIGPKPTISSKCPGDFCNFIVTSQSLSSKQEIDYDDLLQKVKATYFSGKEKDIEKVKYLLRIDNLIEQTSKNKDKIIRKMIPYRLLLLGKKIIIDKTKDLVEVDIGQFINCYNSSLDIEQENLHDTAMQAPFHYYDNVKVCDRCYEIYTLFENNKKKPATAKVNKNFSSTSPTRMFSSSQKSSALSSKMNSPRKGKLLLSNSKKDNIDELLSDMSNALFEIKYGERTAKIRMADEWSRTVSRQRAQSQSQENKRKVPLETVKAEVLDHDAITSQLFPDAKYFMKTKPRRNRHAEYLEKLKTMNFSRGKLHHFLRKSC